MVGAHWLASNKEHQAFAAAALLTLLVGAAFLTWPVAPSGDVERESSVSAETRSRIDRWMAERGLNRYGDPPGTQYSGGTPLFDTRTGARRDRYEYILERHPEPKGAQP